MPLLSQQEPVEAVDPTQKVRELLEWDSNENKERIEQYVEFLTTHPLEDEEASAVQVTAKEEIKEDLALLQEQQQQKPVNQSRPYAIVVLGGGLTLHENGKDIVVNDYTRLRLETTLAVEKQYQLPIVLSGVEAPYMQRWLQNYNVDAKLLEDRSMNTCENTRFSSLLLQKRWGTDCDSDYRPLSYAAYPSSVCTEWYSNDSSGSTDAEVLDPLASSRQNYDHSRRANYEMLATIRDMWFGSVTVGRCLNV